MLRIKGMLSFKHRPEGGSSCVSPSVRLSMCFSQREGASPSRPATNHNVKQKQSCQLGVMPVRRASCCLLPSIRPSSCSPRSSRTCSSEAASTAVTGTGTGTSTVTNTGIGTSNGIGTKTGTSTGTGTSTSNGTSNVTGTLALLLVPL